MAHHISVQVVVIVYIKLPPSQSINRIEENLSKKSQYHQIITNGTILAGLRRAFDKLKANKFKTNI